MKEALLTHWPIQLSYPGAQPQLVPVQDWLNEHMLPQRPQLLSSLMKELLLTHWPLHHSWPAEQLPDPVGALLAWAEGGARLARTGIGGG